MNNSWYIPFVEQEILVEYPLGMVGDFGATAIFGLVMFLFLYLPCKTGRAACNERMGCIEREPRYHMRSICNHYKYLQLS